MIGIDQEPPRDVLEHLQTVFGDGAFEVRYEAGPSVVRACVRLRELPPVGPREHWLAFSPTMTRPMVEAVWRASIERIAAAHRITTAADAMRALDRALTSDGRFVRVTSDDERAPDEGER